MRSLISRQRWILGGLLAGLASSVLASAPVSPDQLPDLGLWLSAADLRQTLADHAPVILWRDRSDHRYDAVFESRVPQAGLAVGRHQPPIFFAGSPSGPSVVAFDARERQSLVLGMAGRALTQRVSGFTAAFLVRASLHYAPPPSSDMPWTPRRYLFIAHLSDYSTRISVQVIEGTGEVRLLSRPVPGAPLDRASSLEGDKAVALHDNTWHRLIATVDYHAKIARIVVDGTTARHALPAGSADLFENIPSPITGIASTTLGDWLSCQLAEILCYERALTDAEVNTLDAYLARQLSPNGQ